MCWQGHNLVVYTICSRNRAPAEKQQVDEAVAGNQSRLKFSTAATKIQTSYEPAPCSLKLPKHKQMLSHCSFYSLLISHSVVTLCLKFAQTLLASSGISKPEVDSLVRGRSAVLTGGNAIPSHQDLQKPVNDQHELCE